MNLPNYKECKILIIGLGYVGLPLAIEFSKRKKCILKGDNLKRKIIGFDIDIKRINELKNGFDRTNEGDMNLMLKLLEDKSLELISSIKGYENADFFIVTVPTPIDNQKMPNLSPLKDACKNIGNLLKLRSTKIQPIIIFESTVFPGATEEICAKEIEKESGLTFNKDFYCGYSPERINPGDNTHRLTNIIKIISGSNKKVTDLVKDLYSSIISAGTYEAPSIKVAEAAKVIENTQRDINIALVNELSMLFKKMNIDTLDVLEAAGTKWNFLPFKPGLVGGHCIGVDPYYLTFKALELGFKPKVILAGRETNDSMANWIVNQILCEISKRKFIDNKINLLILGFTFKENCPDVRNTLVVKILEGLDKDNFEITVVDPYVKAEEAQNLTKLNLLNKIPSKIKFNVVLCTVAHKEFTILKDYEWERLIKEKGFFFDVKGIIPRKLNPIRS